MSKWWKSPVLQGPENDYGDYDYLIEDIPGDSIKWSKWERTCGECGKTHMWNLCYTHYFRTMDGWDSIDHYECWECYIKRKITAPFKKATKKLKKFIYVKKELYKICRLYKKSTGKRMSKDYKDTFKKIYGREV
jgi:hypothetical protein